MKKTTILLAGIMVGAAVLAETNDPMAEERYRMKYGRYTPAEEARRAARAGLSQDMTGACCRMKHGSPATAVVAADASGQQARFLAKYGQLTPLAEARKRVLDAELAAHVNTCVQIGQCSRIHGVTTTVAVVSPAPALTNADMRLRAKYGLTAPIQVPRAVSSQGQEHIASAQVGGCEHECCKHSE
jgi:hypothetical protein